MTRLAVLSDIHGNADALTAVLADMLAFSPDLMINLGDVLSGPLDPMGTAALLEGVPNLTVMGNHDRWLLDPARRNKGWEAWTYPKLDRMTLGWVAGLPTGLVIEEGFSPTMRRFSIRTFAWVLAGTSPKPMKTPWKMP